MKKEFLLLERSISDLQALHKLMAEGENADSKLVVALDAGHGGINPEGLYTTAPAKMAEHPFGVVNEGVTNRKIVNSIAQELQRLGIAFHYLHHEYSDTPLNKRTWKANQLYQRYQAEERTLLVLSIHTNAFRMPAAHGWEVWTSPGTTDSDRPANLLYDEVEKAGFFTMRPFSEREGMHDKEAEFWMLIQTAGIAILSENGFHTNPQEAFNMLFNHEWLQQGVVMPHVRMLEKLNQELQSSA